MMFFADDDDPDPTIRQLNRRIILAIVRDSVVRERCLICGGQKNCVVCLYMVDMRQAGVQGYSWNKLVPVVVLKILTLRRPTHHRERFCCCCWR
jgi:hypothetical protein